ncbi:LysM peptidoglycan-binding domain-containing protein [Aureivirga marina]|uniref:LysM peptidoglycan-binding domain-containing protein n=1 Tax=Aureivirga marina TaxID=1182451 RepID=UPI0018C9382F|nr:LysM peptidoglycan-binding domain-containing protein [Aureivirga marina]
MKINSDGTNIIYNEKVLRIFEYDKKDRPMRMVSVNRKSYTVAKLVCEAWNGLPEDEKMIAKHKYCFTDDHYRNLYWGKRGENKLVRSKLSKISSEDIPVIIDRIKKGDTLKKIAADYGTSDTSIGRVKRRYLK